LENISFLTTCFGKYKLVFGVILRGYLTIIMDFIWSLNALFTLRNSCFFNFSHLLKTNAAFKKGLIYHNLIIDPGIYDKLSLTNKL